MQAIPVLAHDLIVDKDFLNKRRSFVKMASSLNHGHDNTIVNGIGRIGYMSGGRKARWTDEEMPLTFLLKAKEFIEANKQQAFFLFYSLTEPHVPRMPSTIFKGKSKLGYRGDVILQIDWTIGEILKQLDYLGITKNTLIIFSSDNGPVLDDGYQDDAVTKQNGHMPQVRCAAANTARLRLVPGFLSLSNGLV